MKKKIKLFSTIASLCLAVALMAFGVWAAVANDAKFKVNSTVSFTADTMVYGEFKIETKNVVNGAAEATATELDIERKIGEAADATKDWTLKSGVSQTATEGTYKAVYGDGYEVGQNLKFNKTGDYYEYTFTFITASPYALSATPSMVVKAGANVEGLAEATLTSGQYTINLANGNAGITVTTKVGATTQNIANTAVTMDAATKDSATNTTLTYSIKIELTSSALEADHVVSFNFGLDVKKAQA